jgi:release factor glutamine methyltransferase
MKRYKSIREYMKNYDLKIDLPDIKISLFEGVYPPKLDSFLVAKELVEVVREGHRVLDVGTGSGILAILAAKKGASVVATDIHQLSVKCAEYNASLNNVELDAKISGLFESIKNEETFDIIVSNMTALPTPPDEQHDEYITRTVDAGPDGRKYLDPLISQMPKYLKEGCYFITQHSNFANIEKTKDKLEELGFEVELKVYEYPVGKTSGERINYFISKLPPNCHPFIENGKWYQRIGVFRCCYNEYKEKGN